MKRSMGMVQINRTFANTNFTNKTMRDILDQSLEARQHKIQTAREYLQRTRQLFDAFGSSELKSSHAKFAELLNALDSDAIRLVVLGEFSRGKSSLVNALLGIKCSSGNRICRRSCRKRHPKSFSSLTCFCAWISADFYSIGNGCINCGHVLHGGGILVVSDPWIIDGAHGTADMGDI